MKIAQLRQIKFRNNGRRKTKVSVMLIGLLFAVFQSQSALTQTNDEFLAALNSVRPLQLAYNEYYQQYGTQPDKIDDLGYSESDFQNELVDHAGISSQTGAILIGLEDRFGDKQWAALIPEINNSSISWVCQTTLANSVINVGGCVAGLAYKRVDIVLNAEPFQGTLLALNALKLNYAESYLSSGQVPTDMRELGVDQSLLDLANASHVMVDPHSKAMVVGLDDEIFGANQWVAVSPVMSRRGHLFWICRTTLPFELVAVRGCSTGLEVEDMLFTILARRR